jgi:hypothetical protein
MPNLRLQDLQLKLRTLVTSRTGAILTLFLVCFLSYGIFIPFLGFYWDDWGFVWMNEVFGPEGLSRYFSSNRPFWSGMFQITLGSIGPNPIRWQIFSFTLRFLNGLAFWWLLRLIWPKREKFVLIAAVLFLVYPGFSQQAIAITYAHFLMVHLMVLLSFGAMILGLQKTKYSYLWWGVSYLLAIIHQFTMEYFFTLEILRLAILWIKFEELPRWQERAKKVLQTYLPYLAISLGFIYWRVFVFSFQTYQPHLIDDVVSSPITRIFTLLKTVLADVFSTGFYDWFAAFPVILKSSFGPTTNLILWGGMILSGGLVFFSLSVRNTAEKSRKWLLEPIFFSLIGLFVSGVPFWITDLKIGFNSVSDRFTFPMMMVSSILMASLIYLIFQSKTLGIQISAAALIMLGVGFQIHSMAIFRQEWKDQEALYKQIEWRIPYLEPGTTLLSPEMNFPHMSDNSFTGPLNWLFEEQPGSGTTNYLLFYIPHRLGTLVPELTPDQPINKDLLVNQFQGSTAQILAISYDPPGCFRVFDGTRDQEYPNITDEFRDAIKLSDPFAWILKGENDSKIPPEIMPLNESGENWCYYFQKADLAAQFGDWDEVVRLGDLAFATGDKPNDPTERIPFIQGYAYTGNFSRAEELSIVTVRVNKRADQMVCDLWATMYADDPSGMVESYQRMVDALECVQE